LDLDNFSILDKKKIWCAESNIVNKENKAYDLENGVSNISLCISFITLDTSGLTFIREKIF
jgi:hypothetical protein